MAQTDEEVEKTRDMFKSLRQIARQARTRAACAEVFKERVRNICSPCKGLYEFPGSWIPTRASKSFP